jgi:alpha-aminoadipic semialdehyde synthase
LKDNLKNIKKHFWQICDISCDINGSIECTEKTTQSDNPAFVYEPNSDAIIDGIKGDGIVVLAVDNLPTELARDASTAFSQALWKFIPGIAGCDMTLPFEQTDLPPEMKKAVVVYNGELTPDFQYLSKFI